MYTEFILYINKYIEQESIICVFSLILISFLIAILIWQGEKYNNILQSAYNKKKRNEKLTKQEQKIWAEYENYKTIK